MTALTYPPARAVAERMVVQLSADGPPLVPLDAASIEAVVSAAFWASLRQEEGRPPRISLALMPVELATRPLLFHPRIPLVAEALARLAPAVERPGIHLGVWRDGSELNVWGTTRTVPTRCFVLEVVAPGLLVVKSRRNERSAKFANVAVLEGAEVKFVDHHGVAALDAPPALGALGAFYSSAGADDFDNVFVQLAVSMREHGRGGSLLVVPAGTDAWRASIVQPITYSVTPPFTEIAELLDAQDDRPGALRAAVDALAGLTAVDGATIVSDAFDLLAFGAKITRRHGARRVEQVLLTEPIQGAAMAKVEPSQLGGTRHLSAAQFVLDEPDALALVASQDGRFTVFAWSPIHQMVHAHRLETLLL
jgi:hypothetical protein